MPSYKAKFEGKMVALRPKNMHFWEFSADVEKTY
jgi:hypothetical protein